MVLTGVHTAGKVLVLEVGIQFPTHWYLHLYFPRTEHFCRSHTQVSWELLDSSLYLAPVEIAHIPISSLWLLENSGQLSVHEAMGTSLPVLILLCLLEE